MLYLNGTSCAGYKKVSTCFVRNQRRLINVRAHPPRTVKGRGGSGCWVQGAGCIRCHDGKPQSGNVTMTSHSSRKGNSTPLSSSLPPSRATLKVSSLCNMLGKWVNICLVFERFPFVSCDFGALSCATASASAAAAAAASSGVAFVRHSTTNGFTYTDSEPFAHVHLTCISLSLSLSDSVCGWVAPLRRKICN